VHINNYGCNLHIIGVTVHKCVKENSVVLHLTVSCKSNIGLYVIVLCQCWAEIRSHC